MIDFYAATDLEIRTYVWRHYRVHLRDEHIDLLRTASRDNLVHEESGKLVCDCAGGFYIVPGRLVLY